MDRQDYELLADAFAASRPSPDEEPDEYEGWRRAIVMVSNVLEASNPYFSRGLFQYRATGEKWVSTIRNIMDNGR